MRELEWFEKTFAKIERLNKTIKSLVERWISAFYDMVFVGLALCMATSNKVYIFLLVIDIILIIITLIIAKKLVKKRNVEIDQLKCNYTELTINDITKRMFDRLNTGKEIVFLRGPEETDSIIIIAIIRDDEKFTEVKRFKMSFNELKETFRF